MCEEPSSPGRGVQDRLTLIHSNRPTHTAHTQLQHVHVAREGRVQDTLRCTPAPPQDRIHHDLGHGTASSQWR